MSDESITHATKTSEPKNITKENSIDINVEQTEKTIIIDRDINEITFIKLKETVVICFVIVV